MRKSHGKAGRPAEENSRPLDRGARTHREAEACATLDTVGLLCPAPIIKTAEKMGALEPGEILEVLSDDPGVEVDMPAWCAGTGHELLKIEKTGREIRALIRKKTGVV